MPEFFNASPQQPLSPSLRARNNAAAVASRNRISGHLNAYGGQANATAGQNASPLKAAVSGNATTPAAPYKSRLSGVMSGYRSPLSGAARDIKSPLAGAASGYQSPLSGAARGATSPLSGAASGVQAPFAGAASNYHSPLSGIASVPNPDFQPQSLPHRQAQEAVRTRPVPIPQSPLRAALGNAGTPIGPMPAADPIPDQPVAVSMAELGADFPSGGQLATQIGAAIRPPQSAAQLVPPGPPLFEPGDQTAGSPLANALLGSPPTSAAVSPQAQREARSMGQLADLIASTDYFSGPNADGLAAARALGEQQFLSSPQGQRRAAAIADVTRTYNPDFGPGAAMRDRESALAAAAQPSGPTWADRQASSQAGMLGLLSQALAGQGDLPPANVQEGISQLAPGTTLRGASELGTPIVISRGNAQPVSPEQRQAQSAYLADRQGARLGRLREAVLGNAMRRQAGIAQQQQAMLAQAQQQQLQQMFDRDPQAATQLMAAMGQNQIGLGRNQLLGQQIAGEQQLGQQRLLTEAANNQANVGLRRRALRQQHELEKQRLVNEQGLTAAQAEQALAAADRSRAETGMIRDAGSPEGQLRGVLLGGLGEAMPEVMAGDIDLQDRIRGAVGDALRGLVPQDQQLTTSPGAAQTNAQRQPIGPSNAAARLAQTSPLMQAIYGEDTSGWGPSELLAPILSRAGGQAALNDTELARVQQHLRYMAAQNPDLARPSPSLVNRIFGGEEDVLSAGALFDAMLGDQPVTSNEIAEILGGSRQRVLDERQRREQARRTNEQTMNSLMFSFPRMGPG